MSRLKLQSWPGLKGEELIVHWIQSPYRNDHGQWENKVYFRRKNNELVWSSYPWGTLPYFKLGSVFKDGEPIGQSSAGALTEITVDVNQEEILKAIECLPKTMYLLGTRGNLEEHCVIFTTGEEKIVIPCIEIIRALLVPAKFLASAILYPQGLESLFDDQEIKSGKLSLKLSRNVPRELVTDGTVQHLAWLYHDPKARKTWEAVSRQIYRGSHLENLDSAVKLKVSLPLVGPSKLRARVIKSGKITLVLEIVGVTGLDIPFEALEYSHDSLVTYQRNKIDMGTKNSSKPPIDETYELDPTEECPGTSKGPIVIESFPATLGFKEDIFFNRITIKRGPVNTLVKPPGEELQGSGSNSPELIDNILSTRDPVAGGKLGQAEFQAVGIVSDGPRDGLENFIKAFKHMQKILHDRVVSHDVMNLPKIKGKSFSTLEDGQPRKCMLVRLSQSGSNPIFVLEVGRPDNRCLSTLIFRAKGPNDDRKMYTFIEDLLKRLVVNNGSWDNKYLDWHPEVKVIKVRHVRNQAPYDWACRIIEKINS